MKFSDLQAAAKALDNSLTPFVFSDARKNALLQIDRLFGEPASEYSPVLGRFYNFQVGKMIDEISSYSGKSPRLWKFYSSGFIIKDQGKVIAHDINDGCSVCHGRTKLTLKPAHIRKLADLIDEYYCTHAHVDHISSALCDALIKRKKLLVMPKDTLFCWQLKGSAAESLDLPHVKSFLNWQGDASGGIPCAMYVFTLSNGKNVFVRGDIYHKEGFLGCVDFLDRQQLYAHYILITHYYTSGPAPLQLLAEKFPTSRFIPIHEWEFSHRRPIGKPGPATQCFGEHMEVYQEYLQKNRVQCLCWGESIPLD